MYRKIKSIRKGKNRVVFLNNVKTEDITNSKFENIISVQGFGHSGSGAVIDLLREYKGNKVIGHVDSTMHSLTNKNEGKGEVDFIRHAGGILELDEMLKVKNVFINDALLKRYIKLIENSSYFRNSQYLMTLASKFFSQIVELEVKESHNSDYNTYLNDLVLPFKSIYLKKQMEIKEFRKVAREFICNFTNYFYEEGVKYLIMDQMFSDTDLNYKRNVDFCSNLKMIIVYRDPRDVLALAIHSNVDWIPHSDVNEFMTWYRHQLAGIDFEEKNYLLLRFEDLIYNYDNIVRVIEQFLNLLSTDHINKYSSFNPQESIKGVGIWQKDIIHESWYKTISLELNSFCYKV